MTYNVEARVRAGAALLDERGPEDWMEQIDLDDLRMESCLRCILGQLYGYFDTGLEALRDTEIGPRLDPAPYGFEVVDDGDEYSSARAEYAHLNEAWIDYLEGELLQP